MKSYSITDVGRVRSQNQDYVFASDTAVGRLANLFVVADGMGGHKAGDRASSSAVAVFVSNVKKSKDRNPVNIMRKALEKANANVYKEANSSKALRGMGTTIVSATIDKDTLYVANIGDSRLYLIRGNEIRQITRDHSLVEEMIRVGGITREEGRFHPDRNVITRAVGVRENVEADFFDEIVEEDDILLLCSDGLSNMVEDEEIKEIINNAPELESAANRLVKKANENGGRDNITVLLAKVNEVEKC